MKTSRLKIILPALFIAGFFFALAMLTSACGQQKPQPKKPSLTIATTPADASVFILEKERGKTPFQCRLFPDTYIIRLEKKDYQTERIKVIVKPETDSKIEVALKPVTSSVLLTSVPAAAPVLFQGKRSERPRWSSKIFPPAVTLRNWTKTDIPDARSPGKSKMNVRF